MRAVVQGLDLRDSWDRYLRLEGEATDLRTVRSTVAWIREEFAAAAQREDRFSTSNPSPKRRGLKTSARPTRSPPTSLRTAGPRSA